MAENAADAIGLVPVMVTTNDNSPSCQKEMESFANDSPNESNACKPVIKEKTFQLEPVSPFDSGEGLPYAPDGWPNSGDVWSWKVGRRINSAGYYQDRYLYPPRHLQKPTGRKAGFQSKADVERYMNSNFPSMDLGAFFALFSWKVPSIKLSPTKEIVSIPPPVETLETENEMTDGIPIQRKLKQKARLHKRLTRKSFRSVFRPIEQDADAIIDLCSSNEEMLFKSTQDLKVSTKSKLDQLSNNDNGSPENNFVAASNIVVSKEESDTGTKSEKSPKGTIAENFDDYLNTLEDILVLPCTETSVSDLVMSSTPALEKEMTECRKKLSNLLVMDLPSLVSSNYLAELATLASQLRKDPSLTVDQLIKLKLVEEIPMISEIFLEAKRNIEQADKFVSDLEAKKVKVTCLKKEYSELKDKLAQIQEEIDSSSLAIQEIDDQIMQLKSKRDGMLGALESKQKSKVELTSTQTMLANSIPTIVREIQTGHSEKPKWEMKKENSIQREVEILNRFLTLKGFTF